MTARYRDYTIFSGVLSSYIQYSAIIVRYTYCEQYVIHRTRYPVVLLPILIRYSAYNGLPPARLQVIICINAILFLVNHLKNSNLNK